MSKFEKCFADFAIAAHKGFVIEKNLTLSHNEISAVKKILIIKRHQLGDMICTLPMIWSVRKFFTDAEITLVTKNSSGFNDIFENSKMPVDSVINYNSGFESLIYIIKSLKDKQIDLAIIPSTVVFSNTNHLIAYISKVKFRVGVNSIDYEKNKVSYMLNVKKDFLWGINKTHQIERNLDVIRQIGIPVTNQFIKININEQNNSFAENFLAQHNISKYNLLIGLHPGAAKTQNIWDFKNYTELMNLLHQTYNCCFYISQGPDDNMTIQNLENYLKNKFPAINYIKYSGELMKNAAIIAKTNLFISNDTGIMHLASGLNIPLICLFGPTNAFEWGPIGKSMVSIQSVNENVNNITVSQVFETCKALLNV